MRDRLVDYLSHRPGAHFSEMLRDLDVATGTLQYHLRRLERDRTVIKRRDGRYTRYYMAQSVPHELKPLAGFLRQPTPRRIILYLLEHGCVRAGELSEMLSVAPSTLSFHLNRMTDEGALRRPSRGQYELPDAAAAEALLVQFAPGIGDSAVDRFVKLLTSLRSAGGALEEGTGSPRGDSRNEAGDEPRR